MRIGCFLLIGLLLAGCSSNQVTLTMRDGAKIESELLSVRDSSIVIQEKDGAPIAIPYSDFTTVFYDADSPLPYMIGGSVTCIGLGILVSTWSMYGQPPIEEPAKIIPGLIIGGVFGWVLGGALSPEDKVFNVDKWEDRRAMITYSKYLSTEEPDELKKIK